MKAPSPPRARRRQRPDLNGQNIEEKEVADADAVMVGQQFRHLKKNKKPKGPWLVAAMLVVPSIIICYLSFGIYYLHSAAKRIQVSGKQTVPSLPKIFVDFPKIHENAYNTDRQQQEPKKQIVRVTNKENANTRVLTAYFEHPSTMDHSNKLPFPRRTTTAAKLKKLEFPNVRCNCSDFTDLMRTFPINGDVFPGDDDPFLPWIHDYFVRKNTVFVVAQNRRRCDTGEGKDVVMSYREPQITLFQPVPVKEEVLQRKKEDKATETIYRLADSLENATAKETRFLCRFHDDNNNEATTFSQYPFNYEYVAWRKKRKPMFLKSGKDVGSFEFSQLMFSCPIPDRFRAGLLKRGPSFPSVAAKLWLDLIPIRTKPRFGEYLLTEEHVGASEFGKLKQFDTLKEFGTDHVLPRIEDSGRWANLPLCPADNREGQEEATPSVAFSAFLGTINSTVRSNSNLDIDKTPRTRNRFVVCTWTSASYLRRGDSTTVDDSASRLREWIVFHLLVGVDHLYVYDNSGQANDTAPTVLEEICSQFPDSVTYHPWPAKVCSNNRPNFKNPGERSSQYAAEASCRERYGPTTQWMSFIDTDEYLVPMGAAETWEPVLNEMEEKNKYVLKMRSSRGKPRKNLMVHMDMKKDPTRAAEVCKKPHHVSLPAETTCLVPAPKQTYLRVYNCDYIRSPRPDRFARAMKQIYQPAYVLSHFVHYSTITADIARTAAAYQRDYPSHTYTRDVVHDEFGDVFLDELTQGVLVHTKSVLPHETMTRNVTCKLNARYACMVGHECPDTTEFVDALHQKNVFTDEAGNFCNCWVNKHLEKILIPKLETALK